MSSSKSKDESGDEEPYQFGSENKREEAPIPLGANLDNMTALNDKLHADLEGVIIAVESQLK